MEVQMKYTKSFISNDINELLESILSMRFNLKDEYEFMIFLRNSNGKEITINEKLLEITKKIEAIILREIERIGDFVFFIQKNLFFEITNSIFRKYQAIQDNYNKILLNVQKTIETSRMLVDLRQKFDDNKQFLKNNTLSTKKDEVPINLSKQKKEEISILSEITSSLDELSKKPKTNKLKGSRCRSQVSNKTRSPSKKKTSTSLKKSFEKSPLRIEIKEEKISFEKLNFLKGEMEKVDNSLANLQITIKEKCMAQREKSTFQELQEKIVKAYDYIDSMKEDVIGLKHRLIHMLAHFEAIEKENKKLKLDQANLMAYANTKQIKLDVNSEKIEVSDYDQVNTDFSTFQNSSIEMNFNIKRNLADPKPERSYLSK